MPHRSCAWAQSFWLVPALLALATSARGELRAEERALYESVAARQAEMERTLAAWVEQNTGSFHHAGLERFASELARALRELGFAVSSEPGPSLDLPGRGPTPTGPLVIGRRPARSGTKAPRLLLCGHYDTVFEPDSPFQKYSAATAEGSARGPGVNDMKGGLIVMLEALRALERDGALDRGDFTVLLNGDEELGSLGSRPRIESAAREADLGLVFEAARENGAMVRSRRGLGQFHLAVDGVAAHAGGAHEQGRSAVLELAHKIVAIEALTDYERGITLNVGSVTGGTKRNIVPAHAEAWIDLRYDRQPDGEEIERALERLAAASHVEGTRATLLGQLHRPPKLESKAAARLLDQHRAIATDLGLAVPEPSHAGGGTDGSLMSAVGLVTLDSLGVVGDGAHTEDESIALASLHERAALAAILVRRFVYGSLYAKEPGR